MPPDEYARLRTLRDLEILDTPPEEEFDDIVRLASSICGAPMSTISLIDVNRQWFKARHGLDACETDREVSFCSHAILGRDLLVVPDATLDPRFADNPAVTGGPGIRFYAGAPLLTSDGVTLGTLCVVDLVPRRLTVAQLRALRALARQVTAALEFRRFAPAIGARHRAELLADECGSLVGHGLREPLHRLREALLADDLTRVGDALRPHRPELLRLLDDLLELGAGEGSRLRIRRIDLAYLAERAVESVRPIADAKDIPITVRIDARASVSADPVRLGQALAHLLFSAVKYTPSRGRVEVVAAGDGAASLHLRDLSPAPARQPCDLYEHLYRGAFAPAPPDRGADLSLAVVKSILDAHHATVALSAGPDAGTDLHIVFPRPPAETAAALVGAGQNSR
jgi:GAF domain-containing protein